MELLGQGQDLVAGVPAADAAEDRDLLALVDGRHSPVDVTVGGDEGRGVVGEGVQEVTAVHLRADHVHGQLDAHHRPLHQRLLHRDLHHPAGLLRGLDHGLVRTDVVEGLREVDFLEVARAPLDPCHLPGDGHHACALPLGVVEPVDEVQRPRAHGAGAHPDAAADLGLGVGGIGGVLLVADAEPLEPVVVADGLEQRVQGVTGDPEDVPGPGVGEDIEEDLRDGLGLAHRGCRLLGFRLRRWV